MMYQEFCLWFSNHVSLMLHFKQVPAMTEAEFQTVALENIALLLVELLLEGKVEWLAPIVAKPNPIRYI